MKQNLSEMTNAELKRYISENRNNQEAFQAALEVVISRRNRCKSSTLSLQPN